MDPPFKARCHSTCKYIIGYLPRMRQEKNTFWRETMWLNRVTLSLVFFCTRSPPRYGDRVERTQDKEAYMDSRTAREGPCCMLHRQQKQRRGEEIVNRPTQWVAVRCPIAGCAVMKKYSMRKSWTSNRSKSVVLALCHGLNSYHMSKNTLRSSQRRF